MSSCHACGAEIPPAERIGRRQACTACGAELHCCLNCRFYSPGMHNDCAENQAEPVSDKARGNFCDYFALGGGKARPAPSGGAARAKLDELFRKRTP